MIGLIIAILLVGLLMWVLTHYASMLPEPLRVVIIVIACVLLIVYAIRVLGLYGELRL